MSELYDDMPQDDEWDTPCAGPQKFPTKESLDKAELWWRTTRRLWCNAANLAAYGEQVLADHKQQHPLTIPGELLAEACELGMPLLQQYPNGQWLVTLHHKHNGFMLSKSTGDTPAEALSAAIAKARESAK